VEYDGGCAAVSPYTEWMQTSGQAGRFHMRLSAYAAFPSMRDP
jgi:hypothetical protein